MTHTKGPWKLITYTGHEAPKNGDWKGAIEGPDGEKVYGGAFSFDAIHKLANARLIASAPDLLEALERLRNAEKDCVALRNFDVGFEDWADVAELKEAQSEADEAIQKARTQ